MLDKSLHTLEGIVKGIAIDGKINKSEVDELTAWCHDCVGVSCRSPFSDLIPLIKKSISDRRFTQDEINDILWACQNLTTSNLYYDVITADIQRLQGILHGIMADNKIEAEELRRLHEWIDENFHLKGSYPYDEIDSIITSILHDGRIDPSEHSFLKVFFSEFISFPTATGVDQNELTQLKKFITIPGICAVCPEIVFKNKTFCFTGTSVKAKPSEIAKMIKEREGIYIDNVRPDLNYLIVGNNGNPCWAFSCYGRKIEQVITCRKQGINIVVVNECDFWDAINSN
jgi:hypothetical protein